MPMLVISDPRCCFLLYLHGTKSPVSPKSTNERLICKYREKNNRRNHGNDNPSYWAVGYNNVLDLLRTMSIDERMDYVELHNNCCNIASIYYERFD